MRSRIIGKIRAFLDARDFLEVETPMMQPIVGGGTARPFKTHHNALDLDLFLRVSPELYLKRLVIGGLERVFEINRNFRNEGIDATHFPEFTMLEFYQAYATYEDLMALTEEMVVEIAHDVRGSTELEWGETRIDLTPPWPRRPMAELVAEHTGLSAEQVLDRAELVRFAASKGIEIRADTPAGGVLGAVYDEVVEPKLVQPTFVTQFPVEMSPLARRNDHAPSFVDRFELIIAGREMANAFSELNDPEDQRARFEEQMRKRAAGDEEAHEMDADYVRALEYGLPPTAGEGLGIDRLVMLLTGATSIREVILFPQLRPDA
jgi:lysyl-tRNA synthetase, class II